MFDRTSLRKSVQVLFDILCIITAVLHLTNDPFVFSN